MPIVVMGFPHQSLRSNPPRLHISHASPWKSGPFRAALTANWIRGF